MSIWAEIKHSINSDLNKPLNELIDGTKGLTKSDTLYTTLYTPQIVVSSPEVTANVPIKVTMNWAGSFNLKCNLFNGIYAVTSSADLPTLTIYKNGTEYKTLTGVFSSQDKLRTIDCICAKNDVFTFVLRRSTTKTENTAYLSDLGIYADLIDISGVTIESI